MVTQNVFKNKELLVTFYIQLCEQYNRTPSLTINTGVLRGRPLILIASVLQLKNVRYIHPIRLL